MAIFDGHTYYALKDMEYSALIGERIKQLEIDRVVRVIQLVELNALKPRLKEDQMEAFDHDYKVVSEQIDEINVRIEAVRGLSGEFDQPKE